MKICKEYRSLQKPGLAALMSPSPFYNFFLPNKGPSPRRRPLLKLVSNGRMMLARKKLKKICLKSKNIVKSFVWFATPNKISWEDAKRRLTLLKFKSMEDLFLIRLILLVNITRKKYPSRTSLPRMKWLTSLVLPREKDSKVNFLVGSIKIYLFNYTFGIRG